MFGLLIIVEEEPDTTPLWQGMNVKLDLGNTVYTLATTRAKRQQYEIALNCLGHNTESIGICYIGGLDENGKPKDTRTPLHRFIHCFFIPLYDVL